MSSRVVSYALIFTFIVLTASFGFAYASNTSNLRNELNQVQREMDETQRILDQGRAEERRLAGQIQALEEQVNAVQREINAIRGNIEQTRERITLAQAELDELERSLGIQNEELNARLRAMYMNGNISMLDVLLGSHSINNFLTNMNRIQLIHESDIAVIESLETQHRIIETHRQYLNDIEAGLVAERDREAQKQAALRANQSEIDVLRVEVSASNREYAQMLDALEAEATRLIDVILRAQLDSEWVGGSMRWPVPGHSRVSSEYGERIHPILRTRRMHTGIDIPAPSGTNIIAANAGTVIVAGWNNSYGNMIVIDHGGGITTLYAHNSTNLVSVGDIVTAGQTIGRVGSTGMSTGPHLHFEVRVNGQHTDPRGWLPR